MLNIVIDDSNILRELSRYSDDDNEKREIALRALKLGLDALRLAQGEIDAQALQKTGEFILEQIQGSVEHILITQNTTLLQEFSLDQPNSALNRMNRHILGHYEEIKEAITANNVRKQEQRRSTQGGNTFEAQVGDVFNDIVRHSGDHLEDTGDIQGFVSKSKVGDFVITLGDTSAAPNEKIVVEAKRDQSYTQPKALEECSMARQNRSAQVAVFVWDKAYGEAKRQPPLKRVNKDIIVLWDADDPNTDIYLNCAYWLARSMVTPDNQAEDSRLVQVQRDLIEKSLEQISKQFVILETISKSGDTIQREAAKAKKSAEDVRALLEANLQTLYEQISALFA